jgi:hypothetical protein
LYVDVNLCATASEQATSKCKQDHYHDDHEDHQNCDDACAAAAITIVTHEQPPVVGVKDSTNKGDAAMITTGMLAGQSSSQKRKGDKPCNLSPFGPGYC